MKTERRQKLAIAIAATVCISVIGGCGSKTDEKSTTETPVTTTVSREESSQEAVASMSIRGDVSPTDEEIQMVNTTLDDSYLGDPFDAVIPSDYSAYPYFEDVTLDIWMTCDNNWRNAYDDVNDHTVFKQIEELTGIKINFITPTIGDEKTSFNLMMSGGSSDLPDIIINAGSYYTGGLSAGVSDGAFLEMTDLVEKYMPNYSAWRNSTDGRRKDSMTDEGKLLAVYGIKPEMDPIWYGALIKTEALEKTGMEVPETVDEWHDFLTACKDVGYEVPLLATGTIDSGFLGPYGFLDTAFGVMSSTYINEDGKVAYGPVEEGVKAHLETIRAWYEEGLIDPNILTGDSNYRTTMLTKDMGVACTLYSPDSAVVNWLQKCGWDFVGAPYPVLNKGDKPKYSYATNWTGWHAALTAGCDNVEAACAFLDFAFTKKGWEIYNYGEYGSTHLIDENGIPYYPETSPVLGTESMANYKYRIHNFVNIRDEMNANVAMSMYDGKSRDIRRQWAAEMDNISLPATSLTPEEAARAAQLSSTISTLKNEYTSKIMIGLLPVDAMDECISLMKENGIDEYVAIYQAAVDRYNQR